MNTYTVNYVDNTGNHEAMVAADLNEDSHPDETIAQALAHQQKVDINGGVFDINSYELFYEAPSDHEVTKLLLMNFVVVPILSGLLGYLMQKWMHKHVYPKHPLLLFPFHKRYMANLANAQASGKNKTGVFGHLTKPTED